MKAKKLYVLVTGVTGNQGGAVARELLQSDHRVKGLTRNIDSKKSLELKKLGVDLVKGSFDDPESIEHALRGVDAVFLMGSPFGMGVEVEAKNGILVADIARRLNIKHLVYTSVGSAHKNTGIPHFESKFKVEEHIGKFNIPHTIIRPAYFMENFLAPFILPGLKQGRIATPMPPDRKLEMITVKDIGKFVVYILERREEFLNKAIDIASDDLSGKEYTEILSRITEHEIKYYELKYEDLAKFGEDYILMYKWFNDVGYNIDIDNLHKKYPEIGWHRFEDWVKEQDWTVLGQPLEQTLT